ncbi:hypothetical protein ABZ805_05280 [Saccharopolyspora sp. NPDC047091]
MLDGEAAPVLRCGTQDDVGDLVQQRLLLGSRFVIVCSNPFSPAG